MTCPKCHSTNLERVSLTYARGVYELRGRFIGWLLGAGLGLGRYRGGTQSRLSALLSPPRKFSYGLPIVLWLLGFFPFMAFVGRGKLSWTMGLVATLYILLLPALPIAAFAYNLVVYPRKYKRWETTFICRRCGLLIAAQTSSRSIARACGQTGVPSS